MKIRYREYSPAPALRDRVQCYWMSSSDAAVRQPQSTRVLPDGCIDILFELGDPPMREAQELSRSYVVGAMREPIIVRLAGAVDMVGIRFRPGGAPAFLRSRANDFTGRAINLDDVWGTDAGRAEQQLAEASTTAERLAVLDCILLSRSNAAHHDDHVVREASRLIAANAGSVPVRAICEQLRMHPRQLERRFEEQVGLPPKVACRVARFQRAVELALDEPGATLSRIAVTAGFYDQPHFTREFTAFSGLSPTAWLAERRAVASVQDPSSEDD